MPPKATHSSGGRGHAAIGGPGVLTHPRTESGRLCSSFFSPSFPLASSARTGGRRWRCRRALGPGSDPPVLCLSGWRNSECEKAPYLCVSERCCSFWGTLRVLSPVTLIWLLVVLTAGPPPRDWEGRTESSVAWHVGVEPARVGDKGC